MEVLNGLWAFANTDVGLMLIAAVFVYAGYAVYTRKPQWKVLLEKYEGTIITAIKMAEKTIPDDTKDKGLARLDAACKYCLNVYEKSTSLRAGLEIKTAFEEAIAVAHGSLEQRNQLRPSVPVDKIVAIALMLLIPFALIGCGAIRQTASQKATTSAKTSIVVSQCVACQAGDPNACIGTLSAFNDLCDWYLGNGTMWKEARSEILKRRADGMYMYNYSQQTGYNPTYVFEAAVAARDNALEYYKTVMDSNQ